MEERVTEAAYDELEATFQVAQRNALGHSVHQGVWQATGTPLFRQDVNGDISVFLRDALGVVTEQRGADGYEVRVSARRPIADDPVGTAMVIERTSNRDESRAEYLDAVGRLIANRELRASGAVWELTRYDALDRVVQSSIPFFDGESPHFLSTRYGGLDSRPRSADSRSGLVRYDYLDSNLGYQMTDPAGTVTQVFASAINDNEARIDALGQVTTVEHTPRGELRRVTVAGAETLQNGFDPLGRVVSTDSPDRGRRESRYNSFDEVIVDIDGVGEVEEISRDVLGREVVRTHRDTDGKTRHWVQAWDGGQGAGIGRLGSATSFDGHQRLYRYLEGGQLHRIVQVLAGEEGTPWWFAAMYYFYDATGRHISTTFPRIEVNQPTLGVGLRYEAGELVELQQAGSTHRIWTIDERNADGQWESGRFGNGVAIERRFDSLSTRLDTIDARSPGGVGLFWQKIAEYDPVGNVLQLERSLGGEPRRTIAFSYDDEYRMASVNDPTLEPLIVEYDLAGNIASKTDVGPISYEGRRFSPTSIAG
ncbi:MAG: hypothetical protein AAFV32_06100 [Myxococcota bacterium]